MRRTLLAASTLACAVLLSGGAALAQGKSACAPGQNKDLLASAYGPTGSPTPGGVVGNNMGQALSAGFYGNTSNAGVSPYAPTRGHGVTPSISSGPQTVGGDTWMSIGGAIQAGCPPN